VSIAGDTVIHTLTGPQTVTRIANTDKAVHVFAWNGAKIAGGRIYIPPTPCRAQTYRVVLDNGRSLRVSADQRFLVFTKSEPKGVETVQAIDLKPGTSLLPLYLGRIKQGGYPTFKQVGDHWKRSACASDRKRWRSVARMVYEWASGDALVPGLRVKHKDGNPDNCHPKNLYIDGTPRPGNRSKLNRLLDLQRKIMPGNHKVAGCEPWIEEEDVYDVLPQDCSSVAATEVFLGVGEETGGLDGPPR